MDSIEIKGVVSAHNYTEAEKECYSFLSRHGVKAYSIKLEIYNFMSCSDFTKPVSFKFTAYVRKWKESVEESAEESTEEGL